MTRIAAHDRAAPATMATARQYCYMALYSRRSVVCRFVRIGGFTLIELLVVMAIIATLLTIAVPRYFGSVDKSKEVALRQSLNVMRDAIDKIYGDSGAYPDTLDELVSKKYLKAVPLDPITESSTTWQLLPHPDGKHTGIYDIKSGASGTARDGSNYRDW